MSKNLSDVYVVTRTGDNASKRTYGPLPRNDGDALYELILPPLKRARLRRFHLR
jgi:hypothetical protein